MKVRFSRVIVLPELFKRGEIRERGGENKECTN